MKKFVKTILASTILIAFFFAVNACQEDVYPDLQLDPVKVEKPKDQKSETEDQGKDVGVDPR